MKKRSSRLIEQEQNNLEMGQYSKIELYVDQDRCAAVVMGSEDIKSEMQKFQETSGQLKFVSDSTTHYKEGRDLIKHKEYEKAINSFTKAHEISDDINNESYILERSSCHLKLGNYKKALLDVNLVFEILVLKSQVMIDDMINSNAIKNAPSQESIKKIHYQAKIAVKDSFVKATRYKADSLFGLGDFEYALIYYIRLQKLRSSNLQFRGLIDRCTIAIKNTIGKGNPVFKDRVSFQCIQEIVVNRVPVNECYFIENTFHGSGSKFHERKFFVDYSKTDFEYSILYNLSLNFNIYAGFAYGIR
nr:uncharacterized protein LOC121120067 [Lepeophtheirus salmonis]